MAGLAQHFKLMILSGIIPIPIFTGGFGHHISTNGLLSVLLAINLFLIAIAVIRSLIWVCFTLFKEDNSFGSYFEFVVWSNYGTSLFTALGFITINGIALLFWIATFFMDWLSKVNPSGM